MAVEVSAAAAHSQWMSYVRLERKKFGADCSLEPMYQEFYTAVEKYRVRRLAVQEEMSKMYEDAVAKGTRKGGKWGKCRTVRRRTRRDAAQGRKTFSGEKGR